MGGGIDGQTDGRADEWRGKNALL